MWKRLYGRLWKVPWSSKARLNSISMAGTRLRKGSSWETLDAMLTESIQRRHERPGQKEIESNAVGPCPSPVTDSLPSTIDPLSGPDPPSATGGKRTTGTSARRPTPRCYSAAVVDTAPFAAREAIDLVRLDFCRAQGGAGNRAAMGGRQGRYDHALAYLVLKSPKQVIRISHVGNGKYSRPVLCVR